MSGKVVAITGCTTGTGYIAAKACAQKGATVLMLNRQSERAEKAWKSIKEEVPSAEVVMVECDLQAFKSVRKAAAEIRERYPEGIDVLCNNAGIMMMESGKGEDGFDREMTVNHLSHFLLTKELFPLLAKKAAATGEARVVNHSSEARKAPPTKLKAEYLEKKTTDLGGNGMLAKMGRYHQTKLANCVFTFAMHDKLQAANSKVKALVAHPGLAATNLQVTTSKDSGGMMESILSLLMTFSQSAEDGSMGIIQCMCGPDANSGELWGPKSMTGKPQKLKPEKLLTYEDSKNMLWELSCKAIGEVFEIQ